MSSDLEIAKSVELKKINEIAEKFGILEDELIPYGKYKAKVENEIYDRVKDKEDGKLVLVTAINPTPLGEGKTTIAIGLSDALNYIGKKTFCINRIEDEIVNDALLDKISNLE